MDFVTFGMFVLDDIYYPIPRVPAIDVIGGAGTWALLGARMMKGNGSGLGWTVHTGSDFPREVRNEIDSWGTECNFIERPNRLTTRGLNTYRQREWRGEFDPRSNLCSCFLLLPCFVVDVKPLGRCCDDQLDVSSIIAWNDGEMGLIVGELDFEFATERIRIECDMLTEAQLTAKIFHLCCTPWRCVSLVMGIRAKRDGLSMEALPLFERLHNPIIIWEPGPDTCKPGNLPECQRALCFVKVFSPNLEELECLLGMKLTTHTGYPDIRKLEDQCNELLYCGSEIEAIIIRMGAHGSRVIQRDRSVHIEAYHKSFSAMTTDQERSNWRNKIVDPTGAGNAFLGGFAIGYLDDSIYPRANPFERGALYGSVAASLAVEQVGPPILTPPRNFSHFWVSEVWNGEHPRGRVGYYKELSDINHLFANDIEKAAVLGWIERRDIDPAVILRAIGTGPGGARHLIGYQHYTDDGL